jgi:hypothetical protein
MLVAAVLAIASTARAAYPTLFGPTGGPVLPTGDVIQQGELDIAADFYAQEDNNTVPVRLNFGIVRGLEVGGMFAFREVENVWGVNAKYALPLFGLSGLAVGGFYNAGVDSGDRGGQVYTAYTQPITPLDSAVLLRGTLGLNYTWTNIADVDNNGLRPYIGADATFRDLNNAQILAEYMVRTSNVPDARSVASVAVRYPFSPQFSAQVGFTNADPLGILGTSDYRVFAGVALAWGGTATPAPTATAGAEVEPDICQ